MGRVLKQIPGGYKKPNIEQIKFQNEHSGIDSANNYPGICLRCGAYCQTRYDYDNEWYGSTCILRILGIPVSEFKVGQGNKLDILEYELRKLENEWNLSCIEEEKIIIAEEAVQLAENRARNTEQTKTTGAIGDKIQFTARVIEYFTFRKFDIFKNREVNQPVTKLETISPSEPGIRLIYWNSLKTAFNLDGSYRYIEVGDEVRFTGTIKKFDIDKKDGTRLTVLSRCGKAEVLNLKTEGKKNESFNL